MNDGSVSSTYSQPQDISQLATELSRDIPVSNEDFPEKQGSFGHRETLSSPNDTTKPEFNLSAVEMDIGIFTLDTIPSTSPSSFTLPYQFPYRPVDLGSSISNNNNIPPIPIHDQNNHKDNDEDEISPKENQKSHTYANSYSSFTLISGTPTNPSPIPTKDDSPPPSPPSSLPTSSLSRSQQLYPGLSTTPIRTSLPLPRTSSPFPFPHTSSPYSRTSSPFPFSSSYYNPAAQPPMLPDSLPPLSIPKLSTLMLASSPSNPQARNPLTQSCPLPSSVHNPSPLGQYSFAPPPPPPHSDLPPPLPHSDLPPPLPHSDLPPPLALPTPPQFSQLLPPSPSHAQAHPILTLPQPDTPEKQIQSTTHQTNSQTQSTSTLQTNFSTSQQPLESSSSLPAPPSFTSFPTSHSSSNQSSPSIYQTPFQLSHVQQPQFQSQFQQSQFQQPQFQQPQFQQPQFQQPQFQQPQFQQPQFQQPQFQQNQQNQNQQNQNQQNQNQQNQNQQNQNQQNQNQQNQFQQTQFQQTQSQEAQSQEAQSQQTSPIQSPNSSARFPVSSLRKSGILNSSTSSFVKSPSVKFDLTPSQPAIQEEGKIEIEKGESKEEKNTLSNSGESISSESSLSGSTEVGVAKREEEDPEVERKNIIFEILSTEESYVQYLRLIKMIYIWPLRDRITENDAVLSESEIADLFANSETLLQVHITFLKQLRRRLRNYSPGVGIGDIFSEVGPYFKMYSSFVKSYFVKGIKLLRELNASNKKFKAFAQDAKVKCKRLDLSDLLLMPVQRLPRYVLLLESLIKKTPEDHADYALLRKALALIKKVADQVNLGTVDDSESLAILLRIQDTLGINAPKDLVQPHRKLVRQATLPLMDEDGEFKMQSNVYLFNDLFLIVEDKTSNLIESIEISRIFTQKAGLLKGYSWGFELYTSSWTRGFGVLTEAEQDQWLDAIDKSIEVLTHLHPLHNAFRIAAMKDIHSTRKMSVGERASLFEHIAEVHKNRNNPLPPLAHFNPVPSVDAPLTAHVMVEKMRQQQEEMMKENQFLFEKVESHPRRRNNSVVGDFFRRMSSTQPVPQIRLPRSNQIVKSGYLTKQGGFIKNWKRRWFIMGNGHLYYTPDHMSTEVLGHIPLKGTVLEVDHDNTIRPYCMIMHTFSRSYYICADGEKSLDEWMVAISTYFMSLATYHKLNVGIPDLPQLIANAKQNHNNQQLNKS